MKFIYAILLIIAVASCSYLRYDDVQTGTANEPGTRMNAYPSQNLERRPIDTLERK